MDKNVLQDYIDACELIRETERDIRKLNCKKTGVIQSNIKSGPDFLCQEQHFRIQDTAFTVKEEREFCHKEMILQKRKAGAEQIRFRVEEWMLALPARMQRIIRYRYLEGLSWERTAARMGRGATADSVRKEAERFLK